MSAEKGALRDAIAEALTEYLTAYTLPANYVRPISESETHEDVARRCGPILADYLMTRVLSPRADL